jgi:hypothetical protein
MARHMAPALGRFMSADPVGNFVADPTNPQTWNLYTYVMNNPLAYVDPSGACTVVDGQYVEDGGDPCPPPPNTTITVTEPAPPPVTYDDCILCWTLMGGGQNGTAQGQPPPILTLSRGPNISTHAKEQETKLQCTNRIANGFSVAGVIESGFDTAKHPYTTWALEAVAGNTFSGIGSIMEDFKTDPYKTYGDIVGGGLSQGVPGVGEALGEYGVPALLAKGAFGIATDAILMGPLGLGKFGFDALVYAGSAIYCATRQ